MKQIVHNKFLSPLCFSLFLIVVYAVSFKLYAIDDARYWQRIGPNGGAINHFVTNKTQPDIIYASSKGYAGSIGNYFKSINAGKSWVELPAVPNSISYSLYNISTGLAVDSQNPHTLYAYSTDGLLKSTDNAMSWQQLGTEVDMEASSFFALNPYVTQSLRVLTLTEERNIFAMASSDNAGQLWNLTAQQAHLFSAENKAAILLETSDINNPGVLYGVSYTGGDFGVPIYPPLPEFLYKSINAGLDWVDITPPEKAYSGKSLVITDNSEKLYATFATSEWGGGEQTFVSHNGGNDWEMLGVPRENSVDFNLSRVFLDPTDAKILYANVYPENRDEISNYPNRIAKSYDEGETWQVLDVSPYQAGNIVVLAHNNQQLLMNYKYGVLRSENGGKDWGPSSAGVSLIGGRLSIAPGDSSVMYTTDGYQRNYYKSIDAGQHWQKFSTQGSVADYCYAFHINPIRSEELICQSYTSIYKSRDAGESWEVLINERYTGIVYAQDGKTMYSYHAGEIRKSINNGASWKRVSRIVNEPEFGPPVTVPPTIEAEIEFTALPTVNPKNPNMIYTSVIANNSRSLYKSINAGESWKLLTSDDAPGWRSLLIHPLDPDNLLYFVGRQKILLSEDGGDSWESILASTITSSQTLDIRFDPSNPNGLYWVGAEGIQHSTDKGNTWSVVTEGLTGVRNLNVNFNSAGIYAATDSGIFKLSDKAEVSATLDCIFQWAEKTYPDLFHPDSSHSKQWGGYTYRHYQKSNIYLGFFYAQEVHINRADLSSKIEAVGSVEFYRELTGCR